MLYEDEEEKRRQQTAQYINTPYGPARNPALEQRGIALNSTDSTSRDKTNGIFDRVIEPVNKVLSAGNKMMPLNLNDKYKHATVSCVGAQGGVYDAAVTGVMGLGKELVDIYNKTTKDLNENPNSIYKSKEEIFNDSKEDLKADFQGIKQGLLHPDENCEEWMKKYYYPYRR